MVTKCVNLLSLLSEAVLKEDNTKELAEQAKKLVKEYGEELKITDSLKTHYQNRCYKNQKLIMAIRSDIDRYMSECDD